jgi:probable HAF family extracellular repeat protein
MIDLGVFPGDTESAATGVNSSGHVVGYSGNTDPETYEITSRAFLYDGVRLIDLGIPSFRSSASDINDAGQIVGTMRTGGGLSFDHAFIHENGVTKDLNSLLPAGIGLHVTYAYAINNAGQIAGVAVDAARKAHAVLLTPIDEDATHVTINDVTITEGHTGTRAATFTVSLSAASSEPITVAYATSDGTATAGSDYQAAASTITLAPGQTTATVTVLVNGDRVGELNETLIVNLTQASGDAVIADGQGLGTIVDDEPRISIGEMTKKEGNSGTTQFVFSVVLSAPSTAPVTVNFATADSDAKAGEDYDAKSGTVTFSPGQTTKTISITVRGDKKREATEWFSVNLSNALGALIQYGKGFGRILNDD